jgi:hypothetical protein
MPNQIDPQNNKKAEEIKAPVENGAYEGENSSEDLEYLVLFDSIMDEWKSESDDVYR